MLCVDRWLCKGRTTGVQASKHMPHSVYARPWIKREFPTPKQLFICEAISTSFTERDGMGTLEFWPGLPCVIWAMAYFCYLRVPTAWVEIWSLLSSPCQSSRSGMFFAANIPVHMCPPSPPPPPTAFPAMGQDADQGRHYKRADYGLPIMAPTVTGTHN